MFNVIKNTVFAKQLRRAFVEDDDYHDFYNEQVKLQAAKVRLQSAVDAVVKASTELQMLISQHSGNLH